MPVEVIGPQWVDDSMQSLKGVVKYGSNQWRRIRGVFEKVRRGTNIIHAQPNNKEKVRVAKEIFHTTYTPNDLREMKTNIQKTLKQHGTDLSSATTWAEEWGKCLQLIRILDDIDHARLLSHLHHPTPNWIQFIKDPIRRALKVNQSQQQIIHKVEAVGTNTIPEPLFRHLFPDIPPPSPAGRAIDVTLVRLQRQARELRSAEEQIQPLPQDTEDRSHIPITSEFDGDRTAHTKFIVSIVRLLPEAQRAAALPEILASSEREHQVYQKALTARLSVIQNGLTERLKANQEQFTATEWGVIAVAGGLGGALFYSLGAAIANFAGAVHATAWTGFGAGALVNHWIAWPLGYVVLVLGKLLKSL